MVGARAAAGVLARTAASPVLDRTAGRRADAEPTGGPLTLLVGGFVEPLYVTHAGDARLFVVEKAGRIRIAANTGNGWAITGTFLDIRDRVGASGSEQGLLGLAFHPSYASNGRFYVNYTNNSGDTVIAEYRRSDGNSASRTERRLMTIDQPYSNHNGGWLGFKSDTLYIATGDGGGGGDPANRAQRIDTLLGKILRIRPLDPDGSGPKRYGIPSSNPYIGRSGLNEIFARGLRNPWRVSFDRLTAKIWIADVGQERYEEVNRSATGLGLNYGWKQLEGKHCYVSNCNTSGKTFPVAEYQHAVSGTDNCSVTGGYVSRRPGAALEGRYIFGDFCSGRLWDIPTAQSLSDPLPAAASTGRLITSFGEGADGRIYLVDLSSGGVYRVNGT